MRPNLTYLTQDEFRIHLIMNDILIMDNENHVVAEIYNDKYTNAVKSIPALVQIAEMLYDMTLANPESILHQMTLKTLDNLKQ